MNKKPLSYFKINHFINEEAYGGILLIIATLFAMVWANSSYFENYHYLWHELKVGLTWGNFSMIYSLHHWINDGLMALFFFVIGLEIKREIMGGELSSLKKATLPIAAAIGGMLVPALFYVIAISKFPEHIEGWGIPMATDIAFVLGLLAMLGKRVPINLKIFLTALAIADDLGAVTVIAMFYTETINYNELISGAFFLGILTIANFAGVRRAVFYGFVGILGVWSAFVFSGVHATIAGVLIALTIPARTKVGETDYIKKLSEFIDKFRNEKLDEKSTLLTQNQAHIISNIQSLSDKAHTPLQKLEHALHPITAYFILPIFALSNAGIHFEGKVIDLVFHPISIGIIVGLVFGKFIGISLLSRLVVKLKMAELPEGVNWKHIYGAGFIAGIGFTMSIFISDLAFKEDEFKQIAKIGIMAASAISGTIGILMLIFSNKKTKAKTAS